MKLRYSIPALNLILAVGFCTLAIAQWQVNTRVGPAPAQANRQMNTEIYGRGLSSGSMRYAPQTNLMPSEIRYAYRASGAMPSEVRHGYYSQGPMAVGGAITYIPTQSAAQKAMKLSPPQLSNPIYAKPQSYDTSLAFAPSPSYATGSMRYPTPAKSPPALASNQALTSASLSPSPSVAAPGHINQVLMPPTTSALPAGSLRYAK